MSQITVSSGWRILCDPLWVIQSQTTGDTNLVPVSSFPLVVYFNICVSPEVSKVDMTQNTQIMNLLQLQSSNYIPQPSFTYMYKIGVFHSRHAHWEKNRCKYELTLIKHRPPTDWRTERPTDQQTNKPTNQQTNQQTNKPTNQPSNQQTN